MPSGMAEHVTSMLKSHGAKTFTSVHDAIAAASKEDCHARCWALIHLSKDTAKEVHHVVEKDSDKLGVVILASTGPVSQVEVLRAMEYGEVFAAAAEASSSVLAEAIQGASDFAGAAVLLVAESAAVKADGKWTPFIYDPRREVHGESAFIAKSDTIRKEIDAFLARESLLTLIAKKQVVCEDEGQAGGAAGLAEGLSASSKTVTILYTSDTGHAEECAKAIGRQCRNGGYVSSAVRVGTMDSFDVHALPSEPLVIFCVATAGKGEFPGNGRNFWGKLSDAASDLEGKLGSMKYTVFGLGDSHYWGKGTEDSKVNFAKPARDLDSVLEKLGASRFMPVGYGDDQDIDQYHTGFGEFKSQLYSKLGVEAAAAGAEDDGPVKSDEVIKVETRQLRGSLKEALDDITTGQVPFQDTKLIKSHGSYQQDDRDMREERQKMGIENAFSFMIRVRMPGGYCTAEQWIAMDDICEKFANATLKITTRQTWQLHGVVKRDVKNTMRAINRGCMDTIAACGDVCRNVLCTSDPTACSRKVMDEVMEYTYAIHDHCLPRSGAYHEIFLMHGDEMGEKVQVCGSTPVEEEPLYGLTYLPRKYKVAVAVPPSNDVDLFSNCVGFIAIVENDQLLGFNVSVGGGLGFTHNNQKTHPRLADVIGFCKPQDAKWVCEAILTVQRDFGDRTNRKHARVKYTVEDYSADWYREQVEQRLGFKLGAARPYQFKHRSDLIGWSESEDGMWHCGVHIPIGRVKDSTRTAMRKVAEELKGGGVLRMTCNQQVVISEVPREKKSAVQRILDFYKVPHDRESTISGLRRNMIACVALPTCPLAFAEAERYLPTLVERVEGIAERCGLKDTDIVIRMTGCPNSCGRPSMAEIGFIGKAPGTYNMYLGGDFVGERLNTLYAESVTEDQILQKLTPLLQGYAANREKGEHFGDFVVRTGVVKPMTAGRLWWTLPEV